jgi:type IV pilus assembly protein PilE
MMQNKAFMLVDIMVVLAIIGILAAIFVPSYQRHILQGYRLEASAELLRLSSLQSNMQAEHGRFSNDFRELGITQTDGFTESGRYKLQVLLTQDGYQLLADAIGPQEQDEECRRFMLDHTGLKQSQPTQRCWGH